jgi:hypothetical protein
MKVSLSTLVTADNRARHGHARVLRRNVAGSPDTAEIAINDTTYLCRCLAGYVELVKACGEKDEEPEVYHLPADLSGCDCPDATYRRIQCKHLGAVKALRRAGRLS